jgi:uncharacterized protein (TIGR03083 family)
MRSGSGWKVLPMGVLVIYRKRGGEVELSDAVRDETLDLAERLAELDDEQWNSPSLCAQWRIRDVLAHVTAGAEGAFGISWILRSMLRHGFNHSRWVAADGQLRGQQDPGIVLKAFRNSAANPPGARPVRNLMHILIHGQDICRPLDIKRDLPEAHLLSVADFVKDDVHIFGAKKRIAGCKLRATDMDWSHGHGPEIAGPAEALVMMMAGRMVALDDLSGEGKAAVVTTR